MPNEELLSWLEAGDIVILPASGIIRECDTAPNSASFTESGPIREIERTTARLVWSTEDDAFARYVIHCVCRWHSVVSYSKFLLSSEAVAERVLRGILGKAQDHADSSSRFTYILRPNPSRFNANATQNPLSAFETPPATVLDTASSRGGAFDSQDSASEINHEHHSDFEDDVSDVGSLTRSIPDMREASLLPPITQQMLALQLEEHGPSPAPSLAIPTSALQNFTLNEADEEDGAEVTPRPRAPRRMARDIARIARPRSHSTSSPSRSPSSVRRRVPLHSLSIPGATNSLPFIRRRFQGTKRLSTISTKSRTLWSFVYE